MIFQVGDKVRAKQTDADVHGHVSPYNIALYYMNVDPTKIYEVIAVDTAQMSLTLNGVNNPVASSFFDLVKRISVGFIIE